MKILISTDCYLFNIGGITACTSLNLDIYRHIHLSLDILINLRLVSYREVTQMYGYGS